MLRNVLAALVAFGTLLSGAPALADAPIATAPIEITEFVSAPPRLQLAQAVVSPKWAAIYRRVPVVSAGAFVPNAVLLTPVFSAQFAATTLSNSPTFVLFTRFRCLAGTTASIPAKYQSCAGNIAFGNYLAADGSAEDQTGINMVPQDSNASGGVTRFNGGNTTLAGGIFNSSIGSINAIYDDMQWHSLLWFGDAGCTPAAHFICGSVYLDDVQVVAGFSTPTDFNGTKTIGFNVRNFFLNAFDSGQGSNQIELSQFYLATGIASPVVGSTNAPSFNIAKFGTRNTPVDFGPTGANPLPGVTPVIFMCHNAASFLTNCGSGPTPTAVQQVFSTAMKQAYNAPFGPGETPDRPYLKWRFDSHWNNVTCVSTALSCTFGSSGGGKIEVGDLLCKVITIGNTANAANDNFAMAGYANTFGTGSAGTLVGPGSGSSLGPGQGGNNVNLWMGCKTATSAVAAGTDEGAATFTWIDNSGCATGGCPFGGFQIEGNIIYLDFGKYGPTGITPTVNAAFSGVSNTTSFNSVSVTTPAGKSLMIGLSVPTAYEFASPANGSGMGPPATAEGIDSPATFGSGGTGNEPFFWFEKSNGAATVSRQSVGNPNNANANAVVVFQ